MFSIDLAGYAHNFFFKTDLQKSDLQLPRPKQILICPLDGHARWARSPVIT